MSLKNRSQFSSTLDNDLKEKLKDLSEKTKIPISKLLDESIELLLEERGSNNKRGKVTTISKLKQ